MRRRPKLLLTLAAGLVVCSLLIILTRNKEPSYDGRRLSEWVAMYGQYFNSRDTGDGMHGEKQTASAAIRQIGTNALPYLLVWSDYKPAPFLSSIEHLIDKLPDRIGKNRPFPEWRGRYGSIALRARAVNATEAFGALGSLAVSAIPTLAQRATLTNSALNKNLALHALAYIGADAFPILTNVLSRPEQAGDISTIECILVLGTNAGPLIPLLVKSLQEINTSNAAGSAPFLRYLKSHPDLVLPILIKALNDLRPEVRRSAPYALSNLGESARSALPALTNLLNDSDPSVQASASNAIAHITAATVTNAPP